MLLYCEKYIKNEFASMDFNKMDDVKRWTKLINDNYVWEDSDTRSMLNIKNIKYLPYLGPREGRWYDIPDDYWNNFNVVFRDFRVDESNIYRANLEPKIKSDNFNIEKFRVIAPPFEELLDFQLTISSSKELDLNELDIIVEGVGQGNWNEVRSCKFRIIYDLGADDTWSLDQLQDLVRKVNFADSENLHVILSHWDIDHYHAILGMSANEIRTIKSFIAPTLTPNTCTFHRVCNLLISNGVYPSLVLPATHIGRRGIRLVKIFKHGCISIFRATQGKSVNQCGIALLIEGKHKNALLTGDHHYNKLYEDIVSPIYLKSKDFVMVVPHHGGRARKMNLTDWSALSNPQGIISFGIGNRYGHPNNIVETFLRTANFHIDKTNGNKRLIYNL